MFQDSPLNAQTFAEWIDQQEKVEEFNDFLDNQLQSKLGRGYNSASASSTAASVLAPVLVTTILMLLLYGE